MRHIKTFNQHINQHINESVDSMRSLNIDEFVELFKKNCSYFTSDVNPKKSTGMLFRGEERSINQFMLINPGTITRYSKESFNYYNILMSRLPSWRKFPKRNKAVIMSTSYSTASDYARGDTNVYLVIPYEYAKLGISAFEDIYGDFKHIRRKSSIPVHDMNEFNYAFNAFLRYDEDSMDGRIADISDIIEALNFYNEMTNIEIYKYFQQYDFADIQYISYKKIDAMLLTDYFKKHNRFDSRKFYNFLNQVMNPIKNGFTLTSSEMLKLSQTQVGSKFHYREVWTDQPCLMINLQLNENIFNILSSHGLNFQNIDIDELKKT